MDPIQIYNSLNHTNLSLIRILLIITLFLGINNKRVDHFFKRLFTSQKISSLLKSKFLFNFAYTLGFFNL